MATNKPVAKWAIPDDWTENDGSQAVVFCIPNSLKWKATITGMVTQLLKGRSWDGSTGNIKDTQELGREVFETMAFLCLEDLADIVTAINQLTSVIQSQGSSGGGCGCAPPGKDSTDIPPEADEGDPPPPGYVDLTQPQDDKCIQANIILDDLETILQSMIDAGVQQLTWATIGTMEAALVIVLANLTGGPVVWALTILTAIGALVWALLTFAFDLQRILDITVDKREELICAVYNAPDNTTAWDAMQTIYSDEGAEAGDLLFLEALQMTHILFTLFFLPDDAEGQAMQEAIDNYPTVDCSACGEVWMETVGVTDTQRAKWDAVVQAGCIVVGDHWQQTGPHNIYNGVLTPFIAPWPDDTPTGPNVELTFQCTFRMKTVTPGIVRMQIIQGVVKYEYTFVCKDGCENNYQLYVLEPNQFYDTRWGEPGVDPIYCSIAGQNSGTEIKDVFFTLIDNP
jgi:hypothetical protein